MATGHRVPSPAQSPMPSQQGLRRDYAVDLFELPELDLGGLAGQSSPLFVGEAQALGSDS